jgi:hypothetical protein
LVLARSAMETRSRSFNPDIVEPPLDVTAKNR